MKRRLAPIALLMSMALGSAGAAQDCRASVALPPEGWAFLPFKPSGANDTPVFERLVCAACLPVVEVVLAAAPP